LSGAEVVAEKAVDIKDATVEGATNLYNKTAEIAVDVKDKVVEVSVNMYNATKDVVVNASHVVA